ncbi:MAG: hypothetical protein AB1746_07930 [Candidatus Zixiibacteriota bacterium]
MKSDYEKALDSYPNIKNMLDGINRQIWYIFLPASVDDLPHLEFAIVNFKKREQIRNQVMSIQNLCGLHLRPNEPLQEVQAKAQIKGKINDELMRKQKDRDRDKQQD